MDGLASVRGAAITADEALVRRAQLGDVDAFGSLMASRLDRCYRLAWSVVNDDADAADATQEAFVSAWRQLPRLRDPAAFDGWLNRIVGNAARMSRRHRRRLREIPLDPHGAEQSQRDDGDLPGSLVARADIDAVLDRESFGRAFSRLRADDRVLLLLHHVEARPLDEIARSLGVPLGTVKWRLHAARRALERALEAEA